MNYICFAKNLYAYTILELRGLYTGDMSLRAVIVITSSKLSQFPQHNARTLWCMTLKPRESFKVGYLYTFLLYNIERCCIEQINIYATVLTYLHRETRTALLSNNLEEFILKWFFQLRFPHIHLLDTCYVI